MNAADIKRAVAVKELTFTEGTVKVFATTLVSTPSPHHGFKTVRARGAVFFYYDTEVFPQGLADETVSAALADLIAEVTKNPTHFMPPTSAPAAAPQPSAPAQQPRAQQSAQPSPQQQQHAQQHAQHAQQGGGGGGGRGQGMPGTAWMKRLFFGGEEHASGGVGHNGPNWGGNAPAAADPSQRWKQILSHELERSSTGSREHAQLMDESARALKRIEDEAVRAVVKPEDPQAAAEWSREEAVFVLVRSSMGQELQRLEAACTQKRNELASAGKDANALIDVFFARNGEELDKISARVEALRVASDRIARTVRTEHGRRAGDLQQQLEATARAIKAAEQRQEAAQAEALLMRQQHKQTLAALEALQPSHHHHNSKNQLP